MKHVYQFIGCAALLVALLLGTSLTAMAQKSNSRVDASLLQLYAEHTDPLGTRSSTQTAISNNQISSRQTLRNNQPLLSINQDPELSTPAMRVVDNKVRVDAVASGNTAALEADLRAIGMEDATAYGKMISGWLPIEAIPAAEALESLRHVRPVMAMTNVGLVTSQGDVAMQSDLVRTNFGVDGTGQTVGVLSDTFDDPFFVPLTTAADDVANGDLPGPGNPNGFITPVNVLDDTGGPGIDEGRGMLQLIHDVAPGASLAFRTAFNGEADFAQGILDLAAAGATVIVDDIIYFAEPMFMDGLVAQAADAVKAAGIPYFSSAGNSARQSYEAPFRPSGTFYDTGFGPQEAHDFDPGAGVDTWQELGFSGSGVPFSFQWNQPFFSTTGGLGATTDLDICISLTPSTAGLLGCAAAANVFTGDPVETFALSGSTTFYFAILHFEGPFPSLMKYVWFRDAVSGLEHATNSATSYGHANAEGASGVGASFYGDTPPFGQSPPLLEPFSSAGGVPIFFDNAGNPITPVLRPKPDITCVDGTNTTFFLFNDVEPDGFPNFFGTSAAAPHAAAIAALLQEIDGTVTPDEVYNLLESTATDMNGTGFDYDTGNGLCNAQAAAEALAPPVQDTTKPVCKIVGVDPGPPVTLTVQTSDDESGLATINVLKSKNAVTTVPAFTPGTNDHVIVTAQKINQSSGASVVLEVIDVAGNATKCDPVVTTLSEVVPETFELESNYPNPFNPSTTIPFRVAESTTVRLTVFDMLGREVVRLIDQDLAPGTYEAVWEGRDAVGRTVPSGMYLYRITAGNFSKTLQMQLVK